MMRQVLRKRIYQWFGLCPHYYDFGYRHKLLVDGSFLGDIKSIELEILFEIVLVNCFNQFLTGLSQFDWFLDTLKICTDAGR